MPRTTPTATWTDRTPPAASWETPRYINTAQLLDVSSNTLQDVNWNNIFIISEVWAWLAVPKITANWS